MSKKLEILKSLIQNGMSIESQINQLASSASKGDFEIVKYLLDSGVDINSVNTNGIQITALTESAINLNFELTEYLIKRGAKIDNHTLFYPVLFLVDKRTKNEKDSLRMINFLLKSGANDKDGQSLFIACQYNNIEIVKLLIDGDFTDINALDDSALIISLQYNHFEISKYLISSGANVNAQNGKAIITCVHKQNYEMLKYLIQHGADIHTDTELALFTSIEENNFELMKFLVQKGADVNGDNIMNICAENNNIKIAKFLLEHGVNNIIISNALLPSINGKYFEFVKLLIQYGANVNYRDSESLILAASNGNIEILKYLIKNGANVNAQNNKALKISTEKGHLKVSKLLSQESNKPYMSFSSECNSHNLTDEQIQKIGKVLNLKDINKLNLCSKIQKLFKQKSEKIKKEIGKCKTETTLLGTEFTDLHPMLFHILREGDNLYCGDIREFQKLTKNPYTNNSISHSELKNINENYSTLALLFKNTEDIQEKTSEILDTIEITIRKAISNVLSKLRYPNNVELFVNSNSDLLNSFITLLQHDNILTDIDVNNINKINVLPNKKLTLANILNLKLESDTNIVVVKDIEISTMRIALEEIYNNVFKS